jgi:hypothetical protein
LIQTFRTPYDGSPALKQRNLGGLWFSRGRLFASCSLRRGGENRGRPPSGAFAGLTNCGCFSLALLLWHMFHPKVSFAPRPEGLGMAIEPFPSFPGLCGYRLEKAPNVMDIRMYGHQPPARPVKHHEEIKPCQTWPAFAACAPVRDCRRRNPKASLESRLCLAVSNPCSNKGTIEPGIVFSGLRRIGYHKLRRLYPFGHSIGGVLLCSVVRCETVRLSYHHFSKRDFR